MWAQFVDSYMEPTEEAKTFGHGIPPAGRRRLIHLSVGDQGCDRRRGTDAAVERQRWRSVLFVPGDRPDRLAKAGGRGADAVVADLEDAVPAEGKDAARSTVVEHIRRGGAGPLMVRVNAVDSGELERDLEALAPVWNGVDAVLLPKAARADDVRRLEASIAGTAATTTAPRLIPIVETAAGVLAADRVAAASVRVVTLLFGPADLSAELGVEPTADGLELLHARSRVVLAAAAAGLAAPLDGPHLVLGDTDGLARGVAAARRLGFGGKAVIHPDQVAAVHDGFAPLAHEVAWAEEVLVATERAGVQGRGVARLDDGTFIDEPITRRARSILARRATAPRAGAAPTTGGRE